MNQNNSVRQSLEAFRDQIQARVKERMSRPSVIEDLHQKNKEQAEKKSPWSSEFKTDKATYVIMAISGVFTAILGLILGLAPYRIEGDPAIYFHDDWLHIIVAIVYAVAFVTVTEVALLVGKNKFHNREEGNPTQQNTMLAMMILAGISVLGTGWAGGSIGASVLGFLTDFKEIPHNAQKWVVGVVPALLAIYAFLLIAYKVSSEDEKSNRLTEQMKRQQQREHQLNRDMAELEVQELMMLAEDKAYLEAVERGVLTAADAAAAKRAGKTLRQLETEKGQDLDGDGHIGRTPSILDRLPQSTQRPSLPDFRPAPHRYTADEFCRLAGRSREELSGILASYPSVSHVYHYWQARASFMPDDLTLDNFADIYNELLPELGDTLHFEPVKRANGLSSKNFQ